MNRTFFQMALAMLKHKSALKDFLIMLETVLAIFATE